MTEPRIAIIGDLHLGRSGAPLACRVPIEELEAAATALGSSYDHVVVNGDVYDLERGPLPFQRGEYRHVGPLHARAEAALSGPAFAWTAGNHDRALRREAHIEFDTSAGTVRVEHGDRFDPPIKRSKAFTTLVTWASGRARSAASLRPAYEAMRTMEAVLTGSARSRRVADGGAPDPVTRSALRWLDRPAAPAVLVIGHTHIPTLIATPGGSVLANPGDAIDRVRAAIVDVPAREVRLEVFAAGAFRVVDALPLPVR